MTEEEAKTKWCPHIRTPIADGASGGIAVNICEDKHTRCIASDCMMWVHDDSVNEYIDGHCGLAK